MPPALLGLALACTGVDSTSEAFVITSGSATLDVPEGAVDEGVDLAVTYLDPEVDFPAGFESIGGIYAFTPHGTQFNVPVTITLPYDPPAGDPDLEVLRLDDDQDDTWSTVDGVTWAENRCTFTTRTFSFYGAAALTGATGTTDSGTSDTGTGTTDTGTTGTTDTGTTGTTDSGTTDSGTTGTGTDSGTDSGTTVDRDQDGDGYDSAELGGTDCDDLDAAVNPGAVEVCDGKDNDCDGVSDDDAKSKPTWYQDADADGWGDAGVSVVQCDQPSGYVDRPGDCDDTDASVYPGNGC